jgi:hypothetical protein
MAAQVAAEKIKWPRQLDSGRRKFRAAVEPADFGSAL